jgi:hypothetical protein
LDKVTHARHELVERELIRIVDRLRRQAAARPLATSATRHTNVLTGWNWQDLDTDQGRISGMGQHH